MSFISFCFLLFLLIFSFLFFITKKKYRYIILLFANYFFYGWNNLSAVPTLLAATLLTYVGGLVLSKYKKRVYYAIFFGMAILILVIYRYIGFIFDNLNLAVGLFHSAYIEHPLFAVPNLVVPIGLSFYIFQSTSYLNDVYRRNMPPEKNFLRFAAFVSFFPTVLSGPIQRSRDLLPQLKEPNDFSYERARNGFLLIVWGFFQKLVIASQLAAVSNKIFNDYLAYDNIYYWVAAVCYSFYIYCDFSSYSDIACGVAKILGFDILPNFRNPYLSENLADFWNRWHMSLNTWLIENIYIPLGGNRKGKLRKYINIFIVFLFSGIWHGAGWNFIIWGILNGLLRIIGECIIPIRKRIYSALRIDETCISIRILKKLTVFFFITLTWVFFRMTDIHAALHIVRNMLFILPISLVNTHIFDLLGTPLNTVILFFLIVIFSIVQYLRKEDGRTAYILERQPSIIRHMIIAILICACLFAAASGTTTINTQFIYFQFK